MLVDRDRRAARVGEDAADRPDDAWSVLRTERTGPTLSGACELKIAASRVMPPSTTSSYTTSAWSTPYCGCPRRRVVDLHRQHRTRSPTRPSGRPQPGERGDDRRDRRGRRVGRAGGRVARRLGRRRHHRTRSRRGQRSRRARSRRAAGNGRETFGADLGSVGLHRLERRDAVVERRVRVEQVVQLHARPLLSVSRGSSIQRCAVALDAVWMTVVSSFSFFERGDEPGRIARERHARRVGEVLALAAHRELHEPGDDRREDQQHEPEQRDDRTDAGCCGRRCRAGRRPRT